MIKKENKIFRKMFKVTEYAALRNIIFTTAAVDNIDYTPTTTTVTASFHGTSILPGYSL